MDGHEKLLQVHLQVHMRQWVHALVQFFEVHTALWAVWGLRGFLRCNCQHTHRRLLVGSPFIFPNLHCHGLGLSRVAIECALGVVWDSACLSSFFRCLHELGPSPSICAELHCCGCPPAAPAGIPERHR